MNKSLTTAFAAFAGIAIVSTSASAAAISWQASVDLYQGAVSGPEAQSFVDTQGDFVLAFNGTNSTDTTAATVNGVVFTNVSGATLFGGFSQNGVTVSAGTIATPPVAMRDTPNSTFQDGSFNADGEIFNLISSAVFDAATVTFSGLTIGTEYRLQIMTNDARGGTNNGGRDTDWQTGFSDGVNSFDASRTAGTAGISQLSNRDPATLEGEVSGDYIIGTFVADSTTQSFEISGTRDGFATIAGGQAQINALQLRSVVPEPGSLALLMLGGVSVLSRKRR